LRINRGCWVSAIPAHGAHPSNAISWQPAIPSNAQQGRDSEKSACARAHLLQDRLLVTNSYSDLNADTQSTLVARRAGT
jgi:hypothetical protein